MCQCNAPPRQCNWQCTITVRQCSAVQCSAAHCTALGSAWSLCSSAVQCNWQCTITVRQCSAVQCSVVQCTLIVSAWSQCSRMHWPVVHCQGFTGLLSQCIHTDQWSVTVYRVGIIRTRRCSLFGCTDPPGRTDERTDGWESSSSFILFYPLSSSFIHFHLLSSSFILFHPISSSFIPFHPLSSSFILFHTLSSSVILFYQTVYYSTSVLYLGRHV